MLLQTCLFEFFFLTHLSINLGRSGDIYYFSDYLLRNTKLFSTVAVSFDMPTSDHEGQGSADRREGVYPCRISPTEDP